jgi:hypothetical protein
MNKTKPEFSFQEAGPEIFLTQNLSVKNLKLKEYYLIIGCAQCNFILILQFLSNVH